MSSRPHVFPEASGGTEEPVERYTGSVASPTKLIPAIHKNHIQTSRVILIVVARTEGEAEPGRRKVALFDSTRFASLRAVFSTLMLS
jgi:hypothetical protein